MRATFTSPYFDLAEPSRWLRGNHHSHSTVSDGTAEPLELVRAYEDAGYDYLALSEHDVFLDPDELRPHTSMCILPAVEVTSRYGQTLLHLGADRALPPRELEPRQIMEQVHAGGGLFVFNHSNWKPRPDYATDELLDGMTGLRGMEIYCGVIERLPGEARATDRWDRLLSRGWRVFGHGTDDVHDEEDRFVAWNCVQWPAGSDSEPGQIVQALGTGRFYASTGVEVSAVGTTCAGHGAVVKSDADEVRWVTRDGVIVKKEAGGEGQIEVDELLDVAHVGVAVEAGNAVYVRAECLGRGCAAAWTQPFWLD